MERPKVNYNDEDYISDQNQYIDHVEASNNTMKEVLEFADNRLVKLEAKNKALIEVIDEIQTMANNELDKLRK